MHLYLFNLLLVFLPTQLGFHAWPSWSMVLGRRVDYLSPTLFFTDILLVGLICVWCIETRFSSFRFSSLSLMRIASVVLFAGVNIFMSKSPPLAIYAWARLLECVLLVWYVIQTKPQLSSLLPFLSLGVLYSSLIALAQFVFQHSVGGWLWFIGERTFTFDTPGIARSVVAGQEYLRSYATFPHPNALGGFLAITLPWLTRQIVKKVNLFYLCTVILGTLALFCTFSRSAWMIFAFGLAWIFSLQKQQQWAGLVIASMVSLIFFVTPLSFSDESVVVRSQLSIAALSMAKVSPFFGVGLGNFLVVLPDDLPSRAIYFLQPVHNIYLLAVAEIGIIGISIIGVILYRFFRKRKFSASPIFISCIGFILIGLVDHYPVTLQQGRLFFALLVGLVVLEMNSSTRRGLD
jgi:O-antigen ligase